MRFILTLFFFQFGILSISQDSFYKKIELGKYQVGFCDTIIYSDQQSYSQFGYKGPTPFFLQIWHPIKKVNGKIMTFQDYRKRNVPIHLVNVYQTLLTQMDSSFVWYNITEDFVDYDSIDYGNYSYFQVLDTLKQYCTKSYYEKINTNNNFPVIVYHHGAQGLSDENFILAEYFASRGYIVVSSNYHLPCEGKTYGHFSGIKDEAIHHSKSVTRFARNLTKNKKTFYIGHSWGAQTGITYLHEKGWADAFVSLETTLEFWDSLKIETTWPQLNKVMKEHKKDYELPMLFVANTQNDEPFSFFEGIANATTFHVSAQEEFGHESYTSGYLLRYLYNDKFPQPDSLELKSQLNLYTRHLKLIETFFNYVDSNKKIDESEFLNDFYIHSFYKK